MSVSADSRYATTGGFVDVDTGETWLASRQPLNLPVASDDTYVKPRAGERYEAMAYRVWNGSFGERSTRLWWVICDVNNIVNPLAPPDPSKALRIPSAERLVLEVLS